MRVFLFLLHLHPEPLPAAGALHMMLALLTGQAQGGAALGAGAEDVGGGIGGESGLGLALEFGGEAEPGLVFLSPFGNIAGEEAVDRPDQKSQGGEVEEDGNKGQDGRVVAQDVEDGAYEEQDQLHDEQGVVEAVRAVASVEEAVKLFTKIHSWFL